MQLFRSSAVLPQVPDIVGSEEFAALAGVTTAHLVAALGLGLLPMTTGYPENNLLLVKCHLERAILDWPQLHIPGNTKRYARGLLFQLFEHRGDDAAEWAHVAHEVSEAHPETWLTGEYLSALAGIPEGGDPAIRVVGARLVDQDGSPVAGELGVCLGRWYTSLSGYHTRNGAGWVMLACMASVLSRAGVFCWDLGMPLGYKQRLGARVYGRSAYLRRFHAERARGGDRGVRRLAGRPGDASDLVARARQIASGKQTC